MVQRKDAHVVATAVVAKATIIVTHNIRDFAPGVLSHSGLSKIRPNFFCVDLLESHQAAVLAGLRAYRADLIKTPMSQARYIDHLADDKLGMPKLALALGLHEASIRGGRRRERAAETPWLRRRPHRTSKVPRVEVKSIWSGCPNLPRGWFILTHVGQAPIRDALFCVLRMRRSC